jgi:hypothetical protein
VTTSVQRSKFTKAKEYTEQLEEDQEEISTDDDEPITSVNNYLI